MKKIKYIILTLVIIIAFNGCTKSFDELNTDPTNLTEASIDLTTIGLVFAQSQHSAMLSTPIGPVSFYPWRFQISQSLFSDIYAQYFATTAANFDSDKHVIVGGWNAAIWDGFYSHSAPQLKFFEEFTAANDLPIENAIAKVWKTFAYHRMTDFYGPIPFSQFGNGETSVAYDSQESIYRAAFTTLDEAVAVLKANSSGTTILGNNDGIYGGSAEKWLKFANTLRLRLALHVKYADPTLAKTEAEKAVADGVIESNADNALLATNPSSKNGYNVITAWGEFRMSAAMESVLKGYDDPRMPVYYSPAANGDSDGDGIPYEGMRNGQSKADKGNAALDFNGSNSDMGSQWLPAALADGTPIKVLRAAESYFLRAEGALEGWNMGGTAKDLYESGIAMSLEENGVPNNSYTMSTNTPAPVGDINNTPALSDIPVKFDEGGSNERKLEQIITQKWLALYPDSWEAWVDVRRTGYPKLYARLNSDNPNVPVDMVMRRLTYVAPEYENNSEAVNAAVASPEMAGGDKGSTKLWWDKKN
jgi:hypothetical protein